MILHTIAGFDAVVNHSIDRIHLMLAVTLNGGVPPGALPIGPANEIAPFPSTVNDSPNERLSCEKFHKEPILTETLLMLHDASNESLAPGPSIHANPLHQMHVHVFKHLKASTEHILLDVQEYRRARHDLILMMGDSDDERGMHTMDAEHNSDIHTALRLELEGQRVQDNEIGQFREDILHHENETTEQLIENFASFRHNDSFDSNLCHMCGNVHHIDEDCFGDEGPSILNEASEWSVEPPELNTDTDDGDDEIAILIHSNENLLAFLNQQQATIARLRGRITRLNTLVRDLHRRLDHSANGPSVNLRSHHSESASVLVDAHADTSFLIKPHLDPHIDMTRLDHLQIQKQLEAQLVKIRETENSKEELWMYFDSGASRSVISTTSPIRKHLQSTSPAYGSCSIGDGSPLHYLEKGKVTENLEVTVVKDLQYDLFSAVSAAKQGLTSIIDYDLHTGRNNSYTIDKLTGNITPLIERGKGILELPLHLLLPAKACLTATNGTSPTQDGLPPNVVSLFWHCFEDTSFDPTIRQNNVTEHALFAFDIIKSLNERERDFLIHARLGHLPRPKILQMIKNGTTGISDYSGKFKELCKPCLQAKQRAENHGRQHKRHPNGRPGEHLHSDLAVLSTLDINGNKYVLTVVDEITREMVIALLKRKTAENVHRVCKKIQLTISARTGNKLLTWQFDRGTEFLNSTFERWLKMELGVIQRFSNVEHPWENGLAERSFQTLFSMSRSLLKYADLPDRLWGKAILHATYVTNRSPTMYLGGIAPLQFRTQQPLDLGSLRVFGSPAQIFVRPSARNDVKLSDRSVSGTFVGMSDKGNGYIFLIGSSNEFVEVDSKDAKFNETFSDYRDRKGHLRAAPNTPDLRVEMETTPCGERITRNDSNIDDAEDQHEQPPTRPHRKIAPRQFLLPGTHSNQEIAVRKQQYAQLCLDNVIEDNDGAIFILDCMEATIDDETKLQKELELLTACALSDDCDIALMAVPDDGDVNLAIPDPKSQRDIDKMSPKDALRFNNATLTEVNGMKNKKVFINATMDELPPGTKVYQSVVNWTSKTNLGVYVKTKCRICFGGHIYDKTYTDTFAPTVNFCTVLVIICLSAMFSWAMGSLDYSQAYLNADIDEICVMRAPISVREYSPQGKEYFWLLKAIYGHPKASRLWAECLHKKLLDLGYTQFLTDQCVYGRWTEWTATEIKDNTIPAKSSFIFLLIHSDDIIIASHDSVLMNSAKAELLAAFEGTDNGNLTSFCGVEIKTSDDHISLSMEYYWDKLMQKFSVKSDEVEHSPLKTKIKRSECPNVPDDSLKTSYLQIIGSIIYGYTHCRLDLAFPVNMLTRVMHSPAELHYNLLQKLLRYINGTKNWTLNYYKDCTVYYGMDFVFFLNVDAAHADDDESHRSTGGWFLFLRRGQGAVAAKSGQTKDVPLSSTESETIWGSNAAMQGAFVKQFLDETRLFKSVSFELHEDSQPMINAQKRNVSQSRFKHMRTKHHYLRKLIFDGWCKLIKISTKTNTADMTTKILPASTVSVFSKIVLGLHDILKSDTDPD